MGNEVYANGREVSCKAAAGKSICAMPDVCMTPPQTPATPPGVPIPYPNTGMASDCTDGSKNVKVSGEEVLLKDKSYFKKSTGDEAGCAPMKSVITHKIQGKVYFNAWSMDVKFEGENVVRHLDLTTHNHASQIGATPPHPYLDSAAIVSPPECDELDGILGATKQDELPRSKTKTRGKKKKEDGTVSEYDATVAVGFANGGMVGGASSIGRGLVRSEKAKRIGNKYANYAEGIQRGEESNVKTCDGKTFKYRDNPSNPTQGHAEAKIIEDWFKAGAKGKLLLNPSKKPCKDCSQMINEVNKGKGGKKCNKIEVCESSVSRE
jgi:hypothetical protein